MKAKHLVLILIAVGFLVGCGGEDLNKDFKPVGKDAPMPTSMGSSAPGQAKPAVSPP